VRSLEVVLTTACNLSCAYCFQDVRANRSMGWPVLRSALDLLMDSDRPSPKVIFTGGEPMLELPLIMRAVEHLETTSAAGHRVGVTVFTNGTLLDRGTRLARLDDDHPEFLRDRCAAVVTLSSRNLEHLAESFAFLVERGVGEIIVSALVTHDPGWREDTIETLADQFAGILRVSIEHHRRTGAVPFASFRHAEPREPPAGDPSAMCGAAGTDGLAVDVDGQVYGCVLFAESYQTIQDGMLKDCLSPMRLGDIRADGLGRRIEEYPAAARAAGIFTGKREKYSSYRRCEGCPCLHVCSVCPVSIGRIPGNTDPHRVPDLQCAYNLVVLNTDPHRVPDLQCAYNLVVLTGRQRFLEATQELESAARS
jgi:sulfatase maturation enzyme AslB (radical SAM superfamily)